MIGSHSKNKTIVVFKSPAVLAVKRNYPHSARQFFLISR